MKLGSDKELTKGKIVKAWYDSKIFVNFADF